MFKLTEKHIGNVFVGQSVEIIFPYENIPRIYKTTASCDCSSVVNDIANSRIRVKYKAKDVPKHLLTIGKLSYAISKQVTVEYQGTNGATEVAVLVFTGTVHKKV